MQRIDIALDEEYMWAVAGFAQKIWVVGIGCGDGVYPLLGAVPYLCLRLAHALLRRYALGNIATQARLLNKEVEGCVVYLLGRAIRIYKMHDTSTAKTANKE